MSSNIDSETSIQYAEFSPPVLRKKRKGVRPSLSTLVDQCRKSLKESEWYKQCEEILLESIPFDRPFEIICLGLGSPSSSAISRVQYCFLLNLCDHKPVKVSLYDPVFTEEDCGLFEEHELPVSPALTNGAAHLTVYFMPHCDMELYEQVLKVNGCEQRIRNLVLIGNRLEDYVENKPTRELQLNAPHILSIVTTLTSKPLPLSEAWPAAFNNTAVQFLSVGADS
ncbi:hypothetical protein E1B28_008766 [Marasmius oreades]|uniref:SRR1-like domain-containing protein n=1 Tax=Marasmius oreades TaxID=181124 RepID=A0A9P7RYZ3_9AGAR|nr:uncharacterized protein E1B28_008766 [Marasmius oreades]KAG7092409.1 hypothetical protein E1B28_008766 [Marasmius oreades]